MDRVNQTRFMDHEKGGNCVAASIASLLEMPLSRVLDYDMRSSKGDWRLAFGEWLRSIGYEFLCLTMHDNGECPVRYASGEIHVLLGGPTERSDEIKHMVVGVLDFNEVRVVFDPHPSRAGLLKVETMYLIVPRTHKKPEGSRLLNPGGLW